MKWKFLLAFDAFLLCTLIVISARAQENYNYLIVANHAANNGLSTALYDLPDCLKKATGHEFKLIVSDSAYSTGIRVILLGAKDSAFDKRLSRDNPDAFLIQSDGKLLLRIASFTYRGLAEGIYTYLDKLGCRWFHPGDEWTYIPKLKDIRIVINQAVVPDFSLRNFFGSFGTPRNGYADPKQIVDKDWAIWSYRNRLAGSLHGHSWNDFLWRNIQELLAHPEYMAMVDGQRVKPNTAMKFCISNKGFQELFIKDMVAQLKKEMGNDMHGIYSVSVEPSDGEGDCECTECKKLGSVSNRDFLLANLVAKEFQKISPNAYVNLYAYDTHAAPPDFELERNVIVQIIPYGFQNFSSPEEMIAAWKKKNHDLYIYDYYGLPLTNLDMPLKGDLEPIAFAKRVQYWYDQHIKGASLESSYSIGSTGIGLYLFAQMTWNVHNDPNQLLDEYYRLNYGKAAPVVKQAQQILSGDTTLKNTEALARAAHLLKEKVKGVNLDEKQKTHLTDYKAYLVYLKLLYTVQNGGPGVEPAASDSLMRYAYSIYLTMMVHQPPLSEYLRMGPAADYILQNWDYQHPDDKKMKFSTLKQLTASEEDAMFDRTFK